MSPLRLPDLSLLQKPVPNIFPLEEQEDERALRKLLAKMKAQADAVRALGVVLGPTCHGATGSLWRTLKNTCWSGHTGSSPLQPTQQHRQGLSQRVPRSSAGGRPLLFPWPLHMLTAGDACLCRATPQWLRTPRRWRLPRSRCAGGCCRQALEGGGGGGAHCT